MIKMICGACRVEGKLKRASDGPFTLSPAEETRLVNAGVAVFVTTWRQERVATPGEGEGYGIQGDTPPERDPASTGQETGESEDGGEDGDTAELQDGEVKAEDVLDIVDGHFTVDSLMKMTRADMEKLAADMGVDVSKCRNKTDIATLLTAVEVQAENGGDAPPDLSAEDPVV